MKSKFIILSFVVLMFLSNIAFAQYDNDFKIRIGIHFGSGAKSSYEIGGYNLAVNVNDRIVWNTRSNKAEVTKVNSVTISRESYAYPEDAFLRSNTIYYSEGYYYPVVEDWNGEFNTQNNIKIMSDGKALILAGDKNQYISSSDDIVSINGAKYRDFASIYNNGIKIYAINIVGMDNYLKGVISKEMSSKADLEALKAQAVASRNFAISNINKFAKEGFNLCNTTVCQVYGGVAAETASTNLAVDLTSDKLMYYNGEIVHAYFHASSGGRTESSENIWNISKPYLIGVEDFYSLGSSYDTWDTEMSSVELRLQLQKNGIDVGEILNIEAQHSENGRIVDLVINGSKSSYTLKKERIRTVLGANRIRSTYFRISSDNFSLTGNLDETLGPQTS